MTLPQVRRVGGADITECAEFGLAMGWRGEKTCWRALLDAGIGYGAVVTESGKLGAVMSAVPTDGVLRIGKMVVLPEFQRRGLGRLLLQQALAEHPGATAILDATEDGARLYRTERFEKYGQTITYLGAPARIYQPGPTRPGGVADLPQIAKLDAAAYGYDRTDLVAALVKHGDAVMVSLGDQWQITGYGVRWFNDTQEVIGPIVAPDVTTAASLVNALGAGLTAPCRIETTADDADFNDWLLSHGFMERYRLDRMKNGALPTGTGACYAYGQFSHATG